LRGFDCPVRLNVIPDAEPVLPAVAFQRKASHEDDRQAATIRDPSERAGGAGLRAIAHKDTRTIILEPKHLDHLYQAAPVRLHHSARACAQQSVGLMHNGDASHPRPAAIIAHALSATPQTNPASRAPDPKQTTGTKRHGTRKTSAVRPVHT
jgi:hypothetical protein